MKDQGGEGAPRRLPQGWKRRSMMSSLPGLIEVYVRLSPTSHQTLDQCVTPTSHKTTIANVVNRSPPPTITTKAQTSSIGEGNRTTATPLTRGTSPMSNVGAAFGHSRRRISPILRYNPATLHLQARHRHRPPTPYHHEVLRRPPLEVIAPASSCCHSTSRETQSNQRHSPPS